MKNLLHKISQKNLLTEYKTYTVLKDSLDNPKYSKRQKTNIEKTLRFLSTTILKSLLGSESNINENEDSSIKNKNQRRK